MASHNGVDLEPIRQLVEAVRRDAKVAKMTFRPLLNGRVEQRGRSPSPTSSAMVR